MAAASACCGSEGNRVIPVDNMAFKLTGVLFVVGVALVDDEVFSDFINNRRAFLSSTMVTPTSSNSCSDRVMKECRSIYTHRDTHHYLTYTCTTQPPLSRILEDIG